MCLKPWNPILGTPACLKRVFKRVDSVLLFGYLGNKRSLKVYHFKFDVYKMISRLSKAITFLNCLHNDKEIGEIKMSFNSLPNSMENGLEPRANTEKM